MKKLFETYKSTLILLSAVIIGGIVGATLGEKAQVLKPIGDLFLNLMFMLLVPLVFFSVVSGISGMKEMSRLGKILRSILIAFLGTSIVIAVLSLPIGLVFNPAKGLDISSFQGVINSAEPVEIGESVSFMSQLVNTFTVSDFSQLLTRSNMLQLIVMSILVGVAIVSSGEKAKTVAKFVEEATVVIMKLVDMIMKLAPIGLGCYFANIIGELGSQLLGVYVKAFANYTLTCILFFVLFYSLVAFISGGTIGVKRMWKSIVSPTVTSMATCSSVASIPANLKAVKEMGVPNDIAETVIPLGANLQKHGSVISCLFKALLLFSLLRPEQLTNPSTLASIVGVAILGSVVMGAIPGGGMLGEMLVVTSFGFGMEALPIIVVFGTIVDIPATVLNVTGDTVSSMLVARLVEGKAWIKENISAKKEKKIATDKNMVMEKK